jgi:hypothetical protein
MAGNGFPSAQQSAEKGLYLPSARPRHKVERIMCEL